MRRLLGAAFCAAALPCSAQADSALQARLQGLAANSGLTAGIAVIDVRTGQRAAVNGSERFSMMSVYKFPIAIALLRQVAQGRVTLDSVRLLRPSDRRPGPGRAPLSGRIPPEGLRVTVGQLLEMMVVDSDNTASDALLAMIGPAVATREVQQAGGRGISIDRIEGQMALDFSGAALRPGETPTPEAVRAARERVPVEVRRRAAARFPLDPRDTATPIGMAELLTAFSRGEAISASRTRLLRRMMERTVTGPNRLRAGVPDGVALAHRTGTGGGTGGRLAAVNDVGLIAVPGRGDVAVAVFVRDAPEAAAERLIARVSRAVYAHYAAAPVPAEPRRQRGSTPNQAR